jgi:hypothetical protein
MANPTIILPINRAHRVLAVYCTVTPAAEMQAQDTIAYRRPMRCATKPMTKDPKACPRLVRAVHKALQSEGAKRDPVAGSVSPKDSRKAGIAIVALLATVSYP